MDRSYVRIHGQSSAATPRDRRGTLAEREDTDRDDEDGQGKPERRQGPVNRALVIDDLLEASERGHWERQGGHG
jgi:hypothetical protein